MRLRPLEATEPPTFTPIRRRAAVPAWSQPPAPAPRAPPKPDEAKRGTRTTFLNILLGLDLGFLGLNALVGVWIGFVLLSQPDSSLAEEFRDAIGVGLPSWFEVAASLAMMGVVPVLWLLGTRVEPWQGTLRFLHLLGGARWIGRGLLLFGILVGLYAVLVALSYLISFEAGDEEALQRELEALSWPLILAVSLTAGITEEILFRGLLYRWLGWWAQGILFSVAHVAAGNPYQIGFTLVVGLLFGHLRRRGWSLLALMIAHTLYDVFVLALLKLAGDAFG